MSLINDQQKMLNIIFANRNRSYGAYAIRSAYSSTIFKSLFIVVCTIASSVGLAYWLKENHADMHDIGQVKDIDSMRVIAMTIYEDKPEQPKENTSKPNSGGAKQNNLTSTIINDHVVDTAQTLNTDIQPVNTATSTGTDLTGTGTTSLTGSGNGTVDANNNEPFGPFGLDESPEFEGGHTALLAFVKKHLVYPSMAVAEGKQGTLYVKFVVDEFGKVTNILLQNNLGYGLDDEAMRVVKLIPNFKSPGKVKGRPVKTYYNIPIKFKLG